MSHCLSVSVSVFLPLSWKSLLSLQANVSVYDEESWSWYVGVPINVICGDKQRRTFVWIISEFPLFEKQRRARARQKQQHLFLESSLSLYRTKCTSRNIHSKTGAQGEVLREQTCRISRIFRDFLYSIGERGKDEKGNPIMSNAHVVDWVTGWLKSWPIIRLESAV